MINRVEIRNLNVIQAVMFSDKLDPIIKYLGNLSPETRLQKAIEFIEDLNKLKYDWWSFQTDEFISLFAYDNSHREIIVGMILDHFFGRLTTCSSGDSVMILRLTKHLPEPKNLSGLKRLFEMYRYDWKYLYPDLSAFDDVQQLFFWLKESLSKEEVSSLLDDYIKLGLVENSLAVAKYLKRELTSEEILTMLKFLVEEKGFSYLHKVVEIMPENFRNNELTKIIEKVRREFPKTLSYHFDIAMAFTEPQKSIELMQVYHDCLGVDGYGEYYQRKFLNEVAEPVRSQEFEKFCAHYVQYSKNLDLQYLNRVVSVINGNHDEIIRNLSGICLSSDRVVKGAYIAKLLPYPENNERIMTIIANRLMLYDSSLFDVLKMNGFLIKPDLGFVCGSLAVSADHSGC